MVRLFRRVLGLDWGQIYNLTAPFWYLAGFAIVFLIWHALTH